MHVKKKCNKSCAKHQYLSSCLQSSDHYMNPILNRIFSTKTQIILYPECPQRQCVVLAQPWTRVLAQVAAASLAICSPRLYRAILRDQEGTAHDCGSATSQLDLPSLTSLSVAGCGPRQLGVPHLAASVDYCKQLIFVPTFCGNRFPTAGRLLAVEDLPFSL